MKVAFVDWLCDPAQPGTSGLSDLVWAMAAGMAQQGVDVHVIAPYDGAPYARAPAPNGDCRGVAVHRQRAPRAGRRNILGHLALACCAGDVARGLGNVDIIHTVEYTSSAVLLRRDARAPVVLTTPGNIYERIDRFNHFDWTVTATYRWAARVTARCARAIVATSRSMRDWWERTGTPGHRIRQIPLGVDTRRFAPDESAREQLGLGTGRRLLFVGRLQAENGAEQLIRCLPFVLRYVPDCTAHVVGSGPDRGLLQRLAGEMGVEGSIAWHGDVPFSDLPRFYAATDVFVCARLSRVTPRVLFQAMACQAPVVATAVEGIVDFVIPGTTGLLFQPGDCEELALQILALLGNRGLARSLGAAARCYAQTHLDWQVVNERILNEVYLREQR